MEIEDQMSQMESVEGFVLDWIAWGRCQGGPFETLPERTNEWYKIQFIIHYNTLRDWKLLELDILDDI